MAICLVFTAGAAYGNLAPVCTGKIEQGELARENVLSDLSVFVFVECYDDGDGFALLAYSGAFGVKPDKRQALTVYAVSS